MQTEGFRNYPVGDDAERIKLIFFETFKSDLKKITKRDLMDVYYYWIGVACFYFKEGRLLDGSLIFNKYVCTNSDSFMKDILQSIFFLIGSVFPQRIQIYCFIFTVLKLRKYNFN